MTDTTGDMSYDNAGLDAATRRRLEMVAATYSTALETLPDDLGLGILGAEFAAVWRAKVREDLDLIRAITADNGKPPHSTQDSDRHDQHRHESAQHQHG